MPARAARSLALCLAAGCLGCGGPRPPDIGHFVAPRGLGRIHRVVFVELGRGATQPPEIAESMTGTLFQAIQGRRLFHVDVVKRTDYRCLDLPIDKQEPWTLNELAEIRKGLRCDAVLFGRVNRFQPYPRMKLGLYLRLLDLKDGRLVWGVDHIWDTTDRDVELRIRDYYYRRLRSDYEPPEWRLVIMSPAKFQKFVADEVTETLPAAAPEPPNAWEATDPERRKVRTAVERIRHYY